MDITKFALDTNDFVDIEIIDYNVRTRAHFASFASIISLIASVGINFNITLYDILDKYTKHVFQPSRVWNGNIRELALDKMYITTLTNVDVPSVRTLVLKYNLISDITSFSLAAKFPYLHELDLRGNDIVSLTGVIFPYSLTHLYLGSNRIKSIDGVNWSQLLQNLALDSNELSSLYGVIFPDSLLDLDISNNNITTISDFKLPIQLHKLSLKGNPIRSFEGIILPPSLVELKLGSGMDISGLRISNTGKYDITGKSIIVISGLSYVIGLETFLINAKWLMLYLKDISITDQRMITQLVLEGTPYIKAHPVDRMNRAMSHKLAQDLLEQTKENYDGVLILAIIDFDAFNLHQPIPKGPSDPPVIFDLIDIGQTYNLSDTDIINKVLETSKERGLTFADAIKVLRTNHRKCKYIRITDCSTFNIHVEEFNCCYTPDNDIILDYLPTVEKRITPEYQKSMSNEITKKSRLYVKGMPKSYLKLYTQYGDRVLNGYYRSGFITPYIIKYIRDSDHFAFFKEYIVSSGHITDQMIYDFIIEYAEAMDSIFKGAPVVGPEGLTIYRGLTSDLPIARLPTGIVYLNKGILSASLSRDVGIRYTGVNIFNEVHGLLLEFYLPPGTKAIYMESITQYKDEYEIILPNNSKFVVETNDTITHKFVSMDRTVHRTVHRLILD